MDLPSLQTAGWHVIGEKSSSRALESLVEEAPVLLYRIRKRVRLQGRVERRPLGQAYHKECR